MKITEEEYLQMENLSMGYCKVCDEFTRNCTEPDAEDYDCPQCENHSVIGASYALMEDRLIFTEE